MTRRLHHPGPPVTPRIRTARGTATRHTVRLPRGAILMEAVAAAMDALGCDSGVLVVGGLRIGPYAYVMPGPARDRSHAAWYSDPRTGQDGRINHGTALVGRRGGHWWMHCHARWTDAGETRMGHLLPDRVTLVDDAEVTILAFTGGTFEVQHDPETNFPIFHTVGGTHGGNAILVRIAPHEDIHDTLTGLIETARFDRATIYGLGSLIGAHFHTGPAMTSPISETVILPGATFADGQLTLPMACIDPAGGIFTGRIRAGTSAVCVTFECLIVAD